MIRAIFFDLGDTLVVEESVGGRHLWEVELRKIPFVDEVLQKLKGKYRLGIITNTFTSREEHVRIALRRIGLEQYFDIILTSVDLGFEKPDERIFLAALEALNVQPKEAVMVGNRVSKDIVGGNKVGMETILFRWNDRYPEKITSPVEQPARIINSLRELPSIVSEM